LSAGQPYKARHIDHMGIPILLFRNKICLNTEHTKMLHEHPIQVLNYQKSWSSKGLDATYLSFNFNTLVCVVMTTEPHQSQYDLDHRGAGYMDELGMSSIVVSVGGEEGRGGGTSAGAPMMYFNCHV
jgi:hypothetical protein